MSGHSKNVKKFDFEEDEVEKIEKGAEKLGLFVRIILLFFESYPA